MHVMNEGRRTRHGDTHKDGSERWQSNHDKDIEAMRQHPLALRYDVVKYENGKPVDERMNGLYRAMQNKLKRQRRQLRARFGLKPAGTR